MKLSISVYLYEPLRTKYKFVTSVEFGQWKEMKSCFGEILSFSSKHFLGGFGVRC